MISHFLKRQVVQKKIGTNLKEGGPRMFGSVLTFGGGRAVSTGNRENNRTAARRREVCRSIERKGGTEEMRTSS